MLMYWNTKVDPGKVAPTLDANEELGDLSIVLHVTGACFTEKVKKNSRTVVMCELGDQNGPICVLNEGSAESQRLELLLPIDSEGQPKFRVQGTNPSSVSLSGYFEAGPMGTESFADEEELAARMAMMEDEENDDESPEPARTTGRKRRLAEASSSSDDEPPELAEPVKKKPKKEKNKKKKQQNNGSVDDDDDVKDASPRNSPKPKKSPRNSPKASPATTPGKQEKSKKKKGMQTMKGGLKFRDLKVGDGPVLRQGQTAEVYYVGQLTSDKTVFDKTISGDPFSFRVGASEVIKGWDQGIAGMKVGGKRRLIVPAKMGYGARGSPPSIPANASLTFTVELKGIA